MERGGVKISKDRLCEKLLSYRFVYLCRKNEKKVILDKFNRFIYFIKYYINGQSDQSFRLKNLHKKSCIS